MMVKPWGACLIGMVAGTISSLGYLYLTPILERTIHLHDTAGINNLHGIPGIIGSLAAIFAALDSGPHNFGTNLASVFPARAPSNATLAEALGYPAGEDRSASYQSQMQAAALGVTLGISITTGLLTGLLLRLPFFEPPLRKDQFDDGKWWAEAQPPSEESGSEGEKEKEEIGGL
eukprot:TRINITY_DN3149_c0_g2_i13.p2 TRINITY_DN3149_c0_g2~~TRINITY_DN3149_c0_g2_i13.p2  ORF type:complete len:175 (-),score=39.21 TRINITY_DN3149_c0_g2_i13:108-632(-)